MLDIFMEFNEWLDVSEAKGPVGGAFGKTGQAPWKRPAAAPAPQHTPNRMDNRFQNIDARVGYGKGIEKQIFDSLVACGLKLREPTQAEDMYDKIDGWWDTGTGEKPIQIKYRDTGTDILFEVMKDFHRGTPGRDMVGKAEFYAVLTRGHIVLVRVAEAKAIIQQAVEAANREGFDDRGNYRYRVRGGMVFLRVRPDPASRQEKLMAYLPVGALSPVRPPCRAAVTF